MNARYSSLDDAPDQTGWAVIVTGTTSAGLYDGVSAGARQHPLVSPWRPLRLIPPAWLHYTVSLSHCKRHLAIEPHFTTGCNRRFVYYQSKMVCLMFALELDKHLKEGGYNTLSWAAHPGFSHTVLGRNLPWPFNLMHDALTPLISQSATEGALRGNDPERPGPARTSPPTIVSCEPNTLDPEIRQRLWSASEAMTGIPFPLWPTKWQPPMCCHLKSVDPCLSTAVANLLLFTSAASEHVAG